MAVGLARVVDVAILIPRILNTVAGSFKSVYADISVVGSAIKNFSPYGAIYNKLNGKSSNDEFQKDLDARNKVVEEANQDLSNLWNNPANMMEQSVLGRIVKRTPSGETPAADTPDEPKKTLAYASENEVEAAVMPEAIACGAMARCGVPI
ncbi:MAG: hypothetical protein K2Y13_06400, partial [Burkholderiaceae bacterium]|nr:hypothetical protein [Burkholderiaceae bacterium]